MLFIAIRAYEIEKKYCNIVGVNSRSHICFDIVNEKKDVFHRINCAVDNEDNLTSESIKITMENIREKYDIS